MGVRDECVKALEDGQTPGMIAKNRGVLLSTILAYLDQKVGEGGIRRSDILFSIPATTRRRVFAELAGPEKGKARRALEREGISEADIEVVLKYGDAKFRLGDLYEDLRQIEVALHSGIRAALEHEFGNGEAGWWRKGVPEDIRIRCQERREQDEDAAPEPYNYTDLIDLRSVLDKRWTAVSPFLPELARGDKRRILNDLIRTNVIRRVVMHPVRGAAPKEDDFEFLLEFKNRLGLKSPRKERLESQVMQGNASRLAESRHDVR